MNVNYKLTGYRVGQSGTELKVFVPGENLQNYILDNAVRDGSILLRDSRSITSKQRKMIYATIRDICDYTGYLPEEQKEWLKYLYCERTGNEYFSLSDCSIEVARDYINIIIDYCLENGIILTDIGINRTDDIDHYLYSCLKNRVCAVCGIHNSDRHHVTGSRIGMGNNRRKIDNAGRLQICLCRKHHNACHNDEIGFLEKHHIYGIEFNED